MHLRPEGPRDAWPFDLLLADQVKQLGLGRVRLLLASAAESAGRAGPHPIGAVVEQSDPGLHLRCAIVRHAVQDAQAEEDVGIEPGRRVRFEPVEPLLHDPGEFGRRIAVAHGLEEGRQHVRPGDARPLYRPGQPADLVPPMGRLLRGGHAGRRVLPQDGRRQTLERIRPHPGIRMGEPARDLLGEGLALGWPQLVQRRVAQAVVGSDVHGRSIAHAEGRARDACPGSTSRHGRSGLP